MRKNKPYWQNHVLCNLAATSLLLVSLTATGQNTFFLRESPIAWLEDDDEAILRETIDAMVVAPDGTSTNWLNPATGSNGRVQVLDTHEDFGTTCRRLRMRNEVRGRVGGGNFRLCLSKDGQWRFAPETESPQNPNTSASDE